MAPLSRADNALPSTSANWPARLQSGQDVPAAKGRNWGLSRDQRRVRATRSERNKISAHALSPVLAATRVCLLDQYFLDRLLTVTDTNERDHESISILVRTNPHKLQVTVIHERFQRAAAAVDDFDRRRPQFSVVGQ